MKNKNLTTILVIAGLAGAAYYFYNKKKKGTPEIAASSASNLVAAAPVGVPTTPEAADALQASIAQKLISVNNIHPDYAETLHLMGHYDNVSLSNKTPEQLVAINTKVDELLKLSSSASLDAQLAVYKGVMEYMKDDVQPVYQAMAAAGSMVV